MATKAHTLPRNPEQVAWTVLLSSFATFIVLTGSVLLGGWWWLRNAAVTQSVVPVYSGTVLVTRPGAAAPQANPPTVPIASTIVTSANDQANLTFVSVDGQQVLATVQIYGGSQVEILLANSPRYASSQHPHRIRLRVSGNGGRVRALVGVDVDRPVVVEIEADPEAVTRLEVAGSNAEVEATPAESMVTVREGQATVLALVEDAYQAVVLAKDERTQVLPGIGPGQPQPAERNLIRNGDFRDELGSEWVLDIRAPADPLETTGAAVPVTNGGRRIIWFNRQGINFGQVGVVQAIDRDVRGYTTLRLHLEAMLSEQDLKNCGQAGSECPLMVKIDYVDIFGSAREWLQGFYFNYDPGAPGTFCASCPTQWVHAQWPKGEWQSYDSDNLLETFERIGTPAATIRSVTLYASGHTFSSFVTDVQLLAE